METASLGAEDGTDLQSLQHSRAGPAKPYLAELMGACLWAESLQQLQCQHDTAVHRLSHLQVQHSY